LRGLISGLFMPVFFGLAGLTADLTVLQDPKLLMLTAALVLIASIGKFGGAFAGGTLGGMTRRESYALACGMNARGSTEVMIATIGLSMGVLSQNLFSMIITMAILTTMAMPPMLRGALARLPITKEEKERLEREGFEENGFVANLERLLLAADESVNAKFASHLAGLLAGRRGLPITVLHVDSKAHRDKSNEESMEGIVESAAKAIAEADEAGPGDVEITIRTPKKGAEEAIKSEARKGFDLLVIGMDKTLDGNGAFDRKIETVCSGFRNPMAIAVAKGSHLKRPARSGLSLLVPVSGSAVSRRGAEVAIALAQVSPDPLRVVYVSTTRDKGSRRGGASISLAREEAILKDTAAAAARYNVDVKTVLRTHTAPEQAILQEIRSSGANLVVLGVDRIAGDKLDFGSVAHAVLIESSASVLLVADGGPAPKAD
jgi:nucleotide-binding universal stress UspA family protein